MRFLLIACVLVAAAMFLANPELFGKKKKFTLSNGGQISINQKGPKGLDIDWNAIGSDLVDLVTPGDSETPAEIDADGANTEAVATADPEQDITEAEGTQILSAVQEDVVDLSSYEGQLFYIAEAISEDPVQTEASMKTATSQCISDEAPETLRNYFVKLVELVAVAKQLPAHQQRAFFTTQNAELGSTVKLWLLSLPETQRASANDILKSWATRPTDLVSCHLEWLEARQ